MIGNCFIMAIIQKARNPKTQIYFIKPKINPGGHCHVMWKDKDGNSYHFTSDKVPHGLKVLLFKGYIEKLPEGVIEKFQGIKIL